MTLNRKSIFKKTFVHIFNSEKQKYNPLKHIPL